MRCFYCVGIVTVATHPGFSVLLLQTAPARSAGSIALVVLRTAKILQYNVRLSLNGPKDRYRHHFDPISHYSAGHSGPQARYPSPPHRTVVS